jgi:hypothetical protein
MAQCLICTCDCLADPVRSHKEVLFELAAGLEELEVFGILPVIQPHSCSSELIGQHALHAPSQPVDTLHS